MAINFLNITETLVEARINDNTVGSNLPTPRLAFKENGVVSGGISTTGGNLILETSNGTERVRITTTGNAVFAGAITTNLSSEGTYFTGGSGNTRQLSITSGTNISAHALHTFNIASGKSHNVNHILKIISKKNKRFSFKKIARKSGEVEKIKLNNSKLLKKLKLKKNFFTNLDQGIIETYQWYNKS